ncbi:DOMON-like domain-containing protein [Brevundimonas sp.]|uniref:DOMON-like domain-containing protein n=1 Tax=Brevundimonas sp. TaxID=1871086 RepID=UPI002FCBBDB1
MLRHADSVGEAASRVEVTAWRPQPARLALLYVIHAPADELRLPPMAESARVDHLWRHTCLEAFIREPSDDVYYEINLSPSTRWAAYGFDGYRERMEPLDMPSPRIESRSYPDRHELEALIDLGDVPGLARSDWRLGLSAVIEDADGGKAWWALAHPAAQPDFHHSDSFVLTLPAPEPA